MGNNNSTQEVPPPQEPVLRAPQHMLWGCSTREEHYAYIQEACEKTKDSQGQEGLLLLGFEYRMLHNPETCACEDGYLTDDEEDYYPPQHDDDNDDDQEEESESLWFPLERPSRDMDNKLWNEACRP